MMRRFTSAPNPAPRVRLVHLDEAVARRARSAVADAVVAREVRARLGGGDQVVDGDRVPAVRQLDVDERRAALGERRQRLLERRRARSGSTPSPSSVARHADAHALQRVDRRLRVKSGTGARDDVASRGSWPAMTDEHQRRVFDRRRDRSDLIERRREGEQAVARDAAVGRLEPDDAAERGRLADRAAGVGAERERDHAARRRRPPSRRSIRRGSAPSPTGSASGRTRSSRSTIPSRTRRSWSCRR